MSPARKEQGRRGKGPPPVEAPASMAAHDLKNLASRLSALSQNLDLNFDDPLFKPTALDVLKDTVSQLQRLATDIRDHEGRLTIKLRVDLNTLLEEALMEVRPELGRQVEIYLDAREMPPVWGDAFLLRRAFACAMENSLEAMNGESGMLGLSTRIRRRNGKRRIVVEISDTGPGMDRETLKERLFCPFSTSKEDGMGLGVYTMNQIASLHGGTLRIASAPGEGTRVRFFFPVSGR